VSRGNRRLDAPMRDPGAPPRPSNPSSPSLGSRVVSTLRTVVGVSLVVASSTSVAWLARRHVLGSPRFAITNVEVSGSHRRAPAAVVAESGLTTGMNVFAVDLDAARAKILADPWIAEASLARKLPGTISVSVKEREAAALVALGPTFLASADGSPFKQAEPGDPVDLPVITGIRPESLTDDPEGAMHTIRRAIDLAAEAESSGLGAHLPLEEVHVAEDGTFALVVGRGAMELVLGAPPFRRKLQQAARVVAELDRRGAKASAIMLDNDQRPDRVVVRMR
jgi:cell division protein FtsQ